MVHGTLTARRQGRVQDVLILCGELYVLVQWMLTSIRCTCVVFSILSNYCQLDLSVMLDGQRSTIDVDKQLLLTTVDQLTCGFKYIMY